MKITDAFRIAYQAAGWQPIDVQIATRLSTPAVLRFIDGGGMRAESYQRLREKLPHFADLVDGTATVVDGRIVPASDAATRVVA